MVDSGVGYCACGQEIWLDYLRDGLGWRPRFPDVDGREIARCPPLRPGDQGRRAGRD